MRRTAEVAALLSDAGLVTLVSLVSPYGIDRDNARAIHEAAGLAFLEVHVDYMSGAVRAPRSQGPLPPRAPRGAQGLTGVDAPYEPPPQPDLRVGPEGESVASSVDRVLAAIAVMAGHAGPSMAVPAARATRQALP